jgi:outer membrane protein TolC
MKIAKVCFVIVLLCFIGCQHGIYKQEYKNFLSASRVLPVERIKELDKEIQKDGFSLDVAIEYALGNNPKILSALKQWQRILELYPQLTTFDDPILDYLKEVRRFNISWKIPNPLKLGSWGKSALFQARSAGKLYYERINCVIEKVKKTYHELLFTHKAIQINQMHRFLTEKLRRLAMRKYENAKATQYDIARIQIRYAHLLHREILLKRKLALLRGYLNRLLGRRQTARLGRPKDFKPIIFACKLQELLDLADKRRPELLAARENIKKANEDLKSAYLEWIPDFTLGIMHEKNLHTVLAGMRIPLWPRARLAKIREAKARLEQAKADLASLQDKVFYEVKEGFERLMETQRSWLLYRDTILKLASKTYRLAQKGYESGNLDLLTVVEAMIKLEDIELGYQRVIIDFYKALASLKKAVGEDIK